MYNNWYFLSYSYAQSVGAKHFETSAKNNVGVEDLFLGLTHMVIISNYLWFKLINYKII